MFVDFSVSLESLNSVTSFSVILPDGPVPVIIFISTLSFFAKFLARGVASIFFELICVSICVSDLLSTICSILVSGKSSIFSPSNNISPKTVPTGTNAPSSTSILPKIPSSIASTAELTLVDSISTNGSSLVIFSPTVFSHLTTVPSFIFIPHWGSLISMGIAILFFS